MTQGELFALFGAFGAAIAFASGIWWRIEGRIKEASAQSAIAIDAANARATLALTGLADHRVHVAETYTSQQNLNAMRDEIMAAISKIGDRVDRVIEAPRTSRAKATH